MKYDGFISYSHSADGLLAPAVQTGLQRLAKPWYRRRALRLFRDETGLAVNPHLWTSITDAMDQSRYFVLLASPEAAASPWVNREVEHWLASNPPETLLPVLTGGTLVWSEVLGDFDAERSSALAPALAGVYDGEPRHLDMAWAHDESQLSLRHSRFRSQIAALAAPMHGVEPEDLESEDVRLHRRALRLAGVAAVTLVALIAFATVATSFAFSYAATARTNADKATRAARNNARAKLTIADARADASQALAARARAESSAAQRSAEAATAEAASRASDARASQAETTAARAVAARADAVAAQARAESTAATGQAGTLLLIAAELAREKAVQAENDALVARTLSARASSAEAQLRACQTPDP